jgi:hypothetical protein
MTDDATPNSVSLVPTPNPKEQREIDAARERVAGRRRPVRTKIQSEHFGSRKFCPPHTHGDGFRIRLADALGTASADFVEAALHQLTKAVAFCDAPEAGSELELNSALALVEAIRPENEVEAALSLQMAATHRLAMELLSRLRRGSTLANARVFGGLATKLLRAFADQMETLNRTRKGGHQVIRIERVTIADGGQAVIAQVSPGPRGA